MKALLLSMAGVAVLAGAARSAPDPTAAAEGALRAALEDARSGSEKRLVALLAELQTPSFLERLDSAADHANAARAGLHVGEILDALAEQGGESAAHVLRGLTTSKTFLADDERTIALIKAGARLRPAPAWLVRFWDRHGRPDDGFTPTTIAALADNGSRPALQLLARKLSAPAHPDDDKRAWMRREILRHRNDREMVQMCGGLLRGPLPRRLRPALVEVLFDYRPQAWFRPDVAVSAPPLEAASKETRSELGALGRWLLRDASLAPEARAAISRQLEAIERVDVASKGGPG